MSGVKRWFAMSTQFTRDPKIQALGEELGPAAPLVIAVLLGQAGLASEGGAVEATYRDLAHDTFIDSTDAKNAVEAAARLGVLEIRREDERSFEAHFPKWRRYQDSFRKQRQRDGDEPSPNGAVRPAPSSEPGNVRDGPDLSAPRPQLSAGVRTCPDLSHKQDKTGQDNTSQDRTRQKDRSDYGDLHLSSLRATLNRVVEGKRAKPLKEAPAIKACSDFADRDVSVELDKFAHYWLDGGGENRQLKDVVGAWRNWLRRAPKAGRRVEAGVKRAHEIAAMAREAEAQEAA